MSSKLFDEWGTFATVPHIFIRHAQDLSDSARWLFVILRMYTNQENGDAWPSYENLRQLTGWGAATIRKAIKELKDNDWLEVRKRFGASAVYTLKRPSSSETEVLQKLKHSSSETEAQFFRNERTASYHDKEELLRRIEQDESAGARAQKKPRSNPHANTTDQPPAKKKNGENNTVKVPAAVAFIRELTSRFPLKNLWPRIEELLGEDFDRDRLQNCYLEWVAHGFKPTNYSGWLFDWFVNGISEQGAKNNAKSKTRKTAGENLRESVEWTRSPSA